MREAIIQLTDAELDALGFKDVVDATREAGLLDVTELVCHGAGGILEVHVEEPIDAESLDGFPSVEWWERLTAGEAGVTYLMKVEPDTEDPGNLDEHATAHEVSDVTADGIELSVVGSEDEISESVAAIDAAGVSPVLRRLTDFEGSPDELDVDLTDRQREVVETAYELGYYEVPRTATTDDVAAEVDLDPSTVAEHLQRAERNVLGRVVGSTG